MVNERMKILFPAETDGVVFRNNAAITRIPKSSFQLKIRMKNQQKKGNVCFSLDPYKPTLEHSSQRVSFFNSFLLYVVTHLTLFSLHSFGALGTIKQS